MKSIRSIIRYTFYVAIVAILAIPIGAICSFPGWVNWLDGRSSFVDLPGAAAQKRMGGWPTPVDPHSVRRVSYTGNSSRDSSSSWYCIECPEAVAQAWRRHEHDYERQGAIRYRDTHQREVEGLSRTISDPPDLREQTGTTPLWWQPPAIDFQATEVMIWYENFRSGVARATYSAYDSSTQTLWIYGYTAQHDEMWPPGQMPTGEPFATLLNSGTSANRTPDGVRGQLHSQ